MPPHASWVASQPDNAMKNTPNERLRFFRQMHKLVEISKQFMHFCYVEPLIKRFQVRPNEFDLLMRLYNLTIEQPEGVSLKALTRVLNVGQPAASMLVSGLVAKGIVCRRENPADRRQSLLTIAATEREHFDSMAMAQSEATAKILADFPEDKKALLNAFIDEMYDYLIELHPEKS